MDTAHEATVSPESRAAAAVLRRARAAVAGVRDPEIGMPLAELGMVRGSSSTVTRSRSRSR